MRRGKEVPNRSWGGGRKTPRPPRCAGQEGALIPLSL